jgi:hypothetical protein
MTTGRVANKVVVLGHDVAQACFVISPNLL